MAVPLLGSCDGPRERAGEKADVAAGFTDTTASMKSGPYERLGERLDQIREESPNAAEAADGSELAADNAMEVE